MAQVSAPASPVTKIPRTLILPAGYRGDREADAEEVDDEADDGEFQVETRHADAREGQDDVLHEEVDNGAPHCRGKDEVVAVQEGQHTSESEVDGGGSQCDEEMTE